MAEILTPPPFEAPITAPSAWRLTALWIRWLEALFRRQTTVEAQLAALEQRVFDLENP